MQFKKKTIFLPSYKNSFNDCHSVFKSKSSCSFFDAFLLNVPFQTGSLSQPSKAQKRAQITGLIVFFFFASVCEIRNWLAIKNLAFCFVNWTSYIIHFFYVAPKKKPAAECNRYKMFKIIRDRSHKPCIHLDVHLALRSIDYLWLFSFSFEAVNRKSFLNPKFVQMTRPIWT